MNSPHHSDDDLRRREQELRDRERALRLREIEAELHHPPLSPTTPLQMTPHPRETSKLAGKYRQIRNVAAFLGIVVVVAVAVKIASQLAAAVMVGGIAWVAYKMLIDGKRVK
jgi:hypothetical protein